MREQVDPAEWDACALGSGEVNPFTLHSFLKSLEDSKSAVCSLADDHCFIQLIDSLPCLQICNALIAGTLPASAQCFFATFLCAGHRQWSLSEVKLLLKILLSDQTFPMRSGSAESMASSI